MTRDEAIERMERAVRECFADDAETILDALHLPRAKSSLEVMGEIATAVMRAKYPEYALYDPLTMKLRAPGEGS